MVAILYIIFNRTRELSGWLAFALKLRIQQKPSLELSVSKEISGFILFIPLSV